MALQKVFPHHDGNNGNYWKVIMISINTVTRESHVEIALYRNETAKNAGAKVMRTVHFDWNGDDFPFTPANLNPVGMNPVKLAYIKIKDSIVQEFGNKWFEDAVDVVESGELVSNK